MQATDSREAICRNAARARWEKPWAVNARVEALAAIIRKKIDALPPLTEEQRARLVAALRPANEEGGSR